MLCLSKQQVYIYFSVNKLVLFIITRFIKTVQVELITGVGTINNHFVPIMKVHLVCSMKVLKAQTQIQSKTWCSPENQCFLSIYPQNSNPLCHNCPTHLSHKCPTYLSHKCPTHLTHPHPHLHSFYMCGNFYIMNIDVPVVLAGC